MRKRRVRKLTNILKGDVSSWGSSFSYLDTKSKKNNYDQKRRGKK